MDNFNYYGDLSADNLGDAGVKPSGKFTLQGIWEKVLSVLHRETRAISYNTFIKPLVPLNMDEYNFVILAPDELAKESIERRYLREIEKAIANVCDRNLAVKIILEEDLGRPESEKPKKADNGSNLVPKYAFENFIKGKSNELAFSASVFVAEAPGETVYNPLFIYGGVGLGKTHLMHSIGNHILQNDSAVKVLYTTSENLTNDFITSLKERKNQQFRNKYRNVDVLLVDDIQFLSDKEGTQEEFFHTFNELISESKQIVISSDKPPIELKTLMERLRGRFGSGLVVDITQPDFETRTAILEKKADIERISIPREVIQLIARSISSNIRELEGALNKVTAHAKLTKKNITLDLAENALRDLVEENLSKLATPAVIQEIVAAYYNIPREELASKKKTAMIAYTRQVSMYLMRKILDESLTNIGDYHGGRHHSTVVHAINQIAQKCETSDEFKNTLYELENRIKGIK